MQHIMHLQPTMQQIHLLMYSQLSSETSFNQFRLPSVIQNIFIIYFVSIGLILIDLTFNNLQTQTFCNLYASSQKYYANIILLIKF